MAPSPDMAAAVARLRLGECVAILDDESREAETDLFFPAAFLSARRLRLLRTQAGGELYIATASGVARAFGLPFAGEVLRGAAAAFPSLGGLQKKAEGACQGACSVGLSLDHRETRTGAPDDQRSVTCRRFAELWEEVSRCDPPASVERAAELLGEEFHCPGHVFLCIENKDGLAARRGHTELSVALARYAGITPIMVGCVMLCNEGEDDGALPPLRAKEWAEANGVPFLTGKDIMEEVLLKGATANGAAA